jgi:hypothetical protein
MSGASVAFTVMTGFLENEFCFIELDVLFIGLLFFDLESDFLGDAFVLFFGDY